MRSLFNSDVTVKGQVFYVRPFSQETQEECKRLMKELEAQEDKEEKISITEKDGTFCFKTSLSKSEVKASFMESMWGILFRKFLSDSKKVCVDPINSEKFYAVIFSREYIFPCPRKIAA